MTPSQGSGEKMANCEPEIGMNSPGRKIGSHHGMACIETDCLFLELATIAECERSRCPFGYVRRREEDAIERERKDAKEKEDGKCL